MCENEFKAIVLAAGIGSRMRDLTNKKPKCLLPIANVPLIWYPLSMLERAGFSAVTIIVLEEEHTEIRKSVDKLDLKISFKYVSIKQDDDLGTADALRKVPKAGEERDVLVVSCDLVTDQPLDNLLNEFRRHEASLAALFFPCSPDPAPGSVPGPKSKQKPDRDVVGLDPVTSRLVMLASASDFEENLSVRMRALRKHHRLEVHTRLSDAHLYVISKHLWRFITSDDNSDSTLKGEVLPFVVRQQLSSSNKFNEEFEEEEEENEDNLAKLALFKYIPKDKLQQRVEQLSSWSDHPGSKQNPYHGDRLRCCALVAKPPTSGTRVNTLPTYWDLNRQILKSEKWNQLTAGRELVKIDPSSTIKTKKIEQSVVGPGCSISEGVKLERCSVGSNCRIESGAHLSDCTLMDGVNVAEGASLVNCLVCEQAVVEKGAKLKSCLVGYNYTVIGDNCHEHEILSGVVMET